MAATSSRDCWRGMAEGIRSIQGKCWRGWTATSERKDENSRARADSAAGGARRHGFCGCGRRGPHPWGEVRLAADGGRPEANGARRGNHRGLRCGEPRAFADEAEHRERGNYRAPSGAEADSPGRAVAVGHRVRERDDTWRGERADRVLREERAESDSRRAGVW